MKKSTKLFFSSAKRSILIAVLVKNNILVIKNGELMINENSVPKLSVSNEYLEELVNDCINIWLENKELEKEGK